MTFASGDNDVRRKLADGGMALGVVVRSAAPSAVELIGLAGFDYAWIDLEHGSASMETAEHLVRAADAVGIESMIRIPDGMPSSVLRALETGASIVCVPKVDTRAQAESVAQASRFHPAGLRGYTTASRGTGYGMDPRGRELLEAVNRRVMVVAQIETRLGLDNAAQIAAVDGIDVLLIGLGDLSQELGKPGMMADPEVTEAAHRIAAAALRAGKHIAVAAATRGEIDAWRRHGAAMFFCGVDLSLLGSALLALRTACDTR